MQRLKTRPQFQAAMAAGTVSRTAHFALHRLVLTEQAAAMVPPTGPGSQDPQALFGVGAVRQDAWLGAMVPKRWARRSVTRHAIKRQVYAVGSEHEAMLRQGAHVVRLRAGFDKRQFVSATSDVLKQAVRAELQQLFAHAARRLAQTASAAARQAPDGATAAAGESAGVAP
ncbi:ribonuclease P protein component [Delftia tsuruhatensis]|uniref:ribonuclease P protein component n=1 Tax=Delftia tsuruhatensis TaxID=180282 RepID=UPI001F441C85|nr:ribonuclease P protein component [Delftia tsuruhatensis]